MIILNICDLIVGFANKNSLSMSDCITIALALATLLVSIFSLRVACKTLKSQRKTEENTRPNVDIKSQKTLIIQLMRQIFISYDGLFALHYQLIKKDYAIIPSEQYWSFFPDPNDYLYESLFYSNDANDRDSDKFLYFKKFSNECKYFKDFLRSLRMTILSGQRNKIEVDINHLYIHSHSLARSFIEMLIFTFEVSQSEMNTIKESVIPDLKVSISKLLDNRRTYFDDFKNDTLNDINNIIGEYIKKFAQNFENGVREASVSSKETGSLYMFSFPILRNYTIYKIYDISCHTYYKSKPFCPLIKSGQNENPHNWLYYLYDRDN